MHDFIPGQRWISDTELQMGLGMVTATDFRTVTIVFPASGETRVYAKQTAPLTRVAFTQGDVIRDLNGQSITISSVRETNGLLTYSGKDDVGNAIELTEGKLDHQIQLNRPSERLFTGQIDQDKWFELRYQTLKHLNRLAHSDLIGLTGVRTSLIPHQLYIAHEVANRYAPRVLLADEVGLGKTIEAGLILHHQLITERAQRVLIVVPETLLHQWLVEMLRRFNLSFSIFDADRCDAMEESLEHNDYAHNPFDSEQLVLCSLDFLNHHPNRFDQALQGDWDLLVVDEAHHLQWNSHQASPEYTLVEKLAAVTKGVLLLTATPEQLGKESHFARLRLLDPDRFPDFHAFVEEEQRYEPIAQAIEELLAGQTLSRDSYQTLLGTLQEGDNQAALDIVQEPNASEDEKAQARDELMTHLLDRHGTGRVLFRNTRAAVQGFPQRQVTAYPLPLPQEYASCLTEFQSTTIANAQLLLCPELLYQQQGQRNIRPWYLIDPRLNWLGDILKQLKPQKVLVITANTHTVLDIAEFLRTKSGIHAAVFHEGMSIIERDRAAAFFADPEYGSQILICSEIGSEGRNFQFAHHLVLFDLPLNPDLLEQRIGRLDRIGQNETIQIHVPYLENSAQAIMYRWYHEGLNAFQHTCPAGHSVFVQIETTLLDALHQVDEGIADLDALVGTTQNIHQQLNEALHRGRDRLLEFNSCQPAIANALKGRAQQQDEKHKPFDYLSVVFDCYGIDMEDHSEHCYIIRPGDHMQISSFPGLHEDGMTITFDRNTALVFEDAHFITWEHPMTAGAMDLVLSSELGNTAVTAIKHAGLRPGTLLVECLFVLESTSRASASRYLPPTILRVLLDKSGINRDTAIPHELINKTRISVDTETANQVIRSQINELRDMLENCEQFAMQLTPQILNQARQQGEHTLTNELNRLRALRKVNPNIRMEEIEFFQSQLMALTETLESTAPRLDAVRVIVST